MHVTSIDRLIARQDRHNWLNHKPSRGAQLAHAFVEAMLRSKFNGPLEQAVADVVKKMR